MTAKEHYDNHLGDFYSWMTGDFATKQYGQQKFFSSQNIFPTKNKLAVDLGAGHGLQSVSLAKLGFSVSAVDFNKQLLSELNQHKGHLPIHTFEDDIIRYLQQANESAELIVCMGDTLTHLESIAHVNLLIRLISDHLIPNGKVVLAFRDLTHELKREERFIPVKTDENRILTCFLEYFDDHVLVHDILHEKENGMWEQKVSSYPKLRLNEKKVTEILRENNLPLLTSTEINRMIYLVSEKR